MKKHNQIRILSPDGFTINMEGTFSNEAKAKEFFQMWLNGYKSQGYYSCRGERIPLSELPSRCEFFGIKPITSCE